MLIITDKMPLTGTQKPRAWGSLSQVQSGVFRQAELLGIDPTKIRLFQVSLEGSGSTHNIINGDTFDGANYSWDEAKGLYTDGVNLGQVDCSFDITDFSCFTRFTSNESSSAERYALGNAYSGTAGVFQIGITANAPRLYIKDGSLNRNILATGTTISAGETVNLSCYSTLTKTSLFINGVWDSLSTDSVSSCVIPSVALGGRERDGYYDSPFVGWTDVSFIYAGYLSADILSQLNESPYLLLTPTAPVFYSFASAVLTWSTEGSFTTESTGGGDTLLVLDDALHAHLAEQLSLTQLHNLAMQDSTHANVADNLDLLQIHILELIEDANHTHTADELTIIQNQLLAIVDAAQAHTAESLALLQQHLLSLIDATHDHSADNLTLSQIHEIAVNSSLHGHTAGNLTLLLGAIWLAIQDALHGQTASSLPLEQQHLISIAEAVHAHSADSCDVTMAILLAIADALHAHGAEGISLTQEHILAADSALHALLSDNLDLTQVHNLEVADALHSLLSDNVDLLQVHGIDIADSLHTLTSDNITLFIQGLGLGIVIDAGIVSLTPQRGKLVLTLDRTIETLTTDRSVKHI